MKILIQNATQGIDPPPQPIQEKKLKNLLFHHPVLLLVSIYEGVPDLASVDLCAHSVRMANVAEAFPLQRG